MQRSRFRLPQQAWGSTVTKYPANDPHVGPDDFTAGSVNFITDLTGTIQKRLGDANYEASSTTGVIKDLYEAVFSDGARHLLRVRSGDLEYSPGSGTFTSVTAGYSATSNFEFAQYADRVYFGNGVDTPQVYDRTTSYGGVVYTAPKTKAMGAQAPTSAPTVAVGGAGNVPIGSYSYKVTFLYYDFEESNGGTASAIVSPGVASQINLTAVPIGGYGVTARKIYRSNNGGLSYALVGTVSNNTATIFTDNSAIATADIPTDNNTPRNFALIAQHLDRLWVVGDKTELDFSAATMPDIWPTLNTVVCNPRDPITGIVVYQNKIVVFNRKSFGQILGNSSDTFRYAELPGSIGCVDNRTIQIRVFKGIPVLLWLSDKGFYAFNGSSVEYISDDIENLVNFNIQQASQVKGSNTQSSQSQFNSGYVNSGGGIDLTSNPGAITTPNPKSLIDEQAEWEAGSSTSGIVTRRSDIPNNLSMGKKATFLFTAGSASGLTVAGSSLTIPVVSNNTGADITSGTSTFGPFRQAAARIVLARGGTLNNLSLKISGSGVGSTTLTIWNDSGGQPGSVAHVFAQATPSGTATLSRAFGVSLAAGTYWIGAQFSGANQIVFVKEFGSGSNNFAFNNGSGWSVNSLLAGVPYSLAYSYTFTQSAVAASGTWTSAVSDTGHYTQAVSIDATVGLSATSYPGGTSSTVFVDQADSLNMASGLVSQSVGSLAGNHTFTFVLTKQYWRVRVQLSTTDDRTTPSVTADPTLSYPSTVTWISATVDNTTEITALNTLITSVSSLPSGTTVTAVIQKSTLPSSGFVDEGSFILVAGVNSTSLATVTNPLRRYTRVKLVLVNSVTPTNAPVVVSTQLNWTITANFYSQVIDTGATPAGWDIFQANVSGSGVTFKMRSDAASANLSDDVPAGPFAPAFVSVTSGSFPTSVPINRFTQWNAQLVSTADNVSTIDSVAINWFISIVNSIRPASIFLNQNYYVSLATYGSSVNNTVLVLDQNGNWRVWEDQAIGTLSFFFAEPYFGDASVAQVRKFLSGTTDHGAAIPLDLRFKAFDFEDVTKQKVLRQVFLIAENTGATYTLDYSTDRGQTWLALVDATGMATFTLPTNSDFTSKRVVPESDDIANGKTLLVRVREESTSTVKIHELQIDAYTRQGDTING